MEKVLRKEKEHFTNTQSNSWNQFEKYSNLIVRVCTLWILFTLILRWIQSALPLNYYSLKLISVKNDYAYWLFRYTQIDRLILQNSTSATLFTLSLFVSIILLFLFPRLWLIRFNAFVHYCIFAILNNLYITHHMHYFMLIILFLLALLFPFRLFSYTWNAMRFYVCWLYASAFLWKVRFGAFLDWNTGVETVKNNMAKWVYQNPEHFLTDIIHFGIAHPFIFNFGHKLVLIAEGIFLIGFFTKKYDKLLIFSALLIFISTALFSDVFFIEQLFIIILLFLSPHYWEKLNNITNSIMPCNKSKGSSI